MVDAKWGEVQLISHEHFKFIDGEQLNKIQSLHLLKFRRSVQAQLFIFDDLIFHVDFQGLLFFSEMIFLSVCQKQNCCTLRGETIWH